MLMSAAGMTRTPTSRSATASERRKKLVALCSFFSRDTASITKIFPPTVKKMMTKIIKADQFFPLFQQLVTSPEKLDLDWF